MFSADSAGLDFRINSCITCNHRVNEYGNETGRGLKTNLTISDASILYLLNWSTNRSIEFDINTRSERNDQYNK